MKTRQILSIIVVLAAQHSGATETPAERTLSSFVKEIHFESATSNVVVSLTNGRFSVSPTLEGVGSHVSTSNEVIRIPPNGFLSLASHHFGLELFFLPEYAPVKFRGILRNANENGSRFLAVWIKGADHSSKKDDMLLVCLSPELMIPFVKKMGWHPKSSSDETTFDGLLPGSYCHFKSENDGEYWLFHFSLNLSQNENVHE